MVEWFIINFIKCFKFKQNRLNDFTNNPFWKAKLLFIKAYSDAKLDFKQII